MKRSAAVIVVGVLFGGAVPVSAGLQQFASVMPNPVRHGKRLTIKAFNCLSGPTWEPVVSMSIVSSDGDVKYSAHVPGDEVDGINVTKIKIRKKKYPSGTYTVYVDCIHEMLITSEYDYQTEHELKVKKRRKK